jgi:hypothetical protein
MKFAAMLRLTLTLVVVMATSQAGAQDTPQRKASSGSGIQAVVTPAVDGIPDVVGTITYDNNTPFQRDPQVNGTVGNRFSGMQNPHAVTSLTFRLAGNYGASVVASIWDPGAGTAMLLRRFLVMGVPTGSASTGSTIMAAVGNRVASVTSISPITGHSGDFVAAIRNTAYTGLQCVPPASALNSTCDGVALTEGVATIGGGLHGARIAFSATTFVPTTTVVGSSGVSFMQNAILRATGDNLPVELMSFSVD